MILETDRLILRPWSTKDADALYELAKDPRVGPPCGWKPHESVRESRDILERILINDFTFAVERQATGELIGNISLMPPGESRYARKPEQAEIGFWLGYDYWGQGYMPEACRRLIQYGFETLGLEEIICVHNADNRNSARAQAKSGFTYLFTDEQGADDQPERIIKTVNHIEKKDYAAEKKRCHERI